MLGHRLVMPAVVPPQPPSYHATRPAEQQLADVQLIITHYYPEVAASYNTPDGPEAFSADMRLLTLMKTALPARVQAEVAALRNEQLAAFRKIAEALGFLGNTAYPTTVALKVQELLEQVRTCECGARIAWHDENCYRCEEAMRGDCE